MEKALKTIHSSTKKIMNNYGLNNLTFTEINTLIFIGEYSKSMKDIITDMVVANSTPTRIIDGLVSKGIVERFADKDDRRKVIIKLTNTGIDIYNQINIIRNEQIEKAFRNLTYDEKESFVKFINIVIKSIENKD